MPLNPETLRYETRDRRAYITLNRPERLNAITVEMGREIAAAVAEANDDDAVRVIIVPGAGRAFSSGYDLKVYAEGGAGHQGEVWDPIRDYRDDAGEHRQLLLAVAVAEADDRQGSRVCRRGRQ